MFTITVKDEQKVELDKLQLIRGINDAKSDLKTIQIKLDNKDEFFKEFQSITLYTAC